MYTHIRKHIHASIHTDIHIYVHTCRSGSWNNWLLGDPEALNISRIPPGPRPVSTLQYIVLVQYSTTSLQSKPAHPETPQSLLAHLGRQRENAVLENRSLSYSSLSRSLFLSTLYICKLHFLATCPTTAPRCELAETHISGVLESACSTKNPAWQMLAVVRSVESARRGGAKGLFKDLENYISGFAMFDSFRLPMQP